MFTFSDPKPTSTKRTLGACAFALALAIVPAASLAGCAGQTDTSASSATSNSTAEALAITIPADQDVQATLNALDEGLCSWNMGGTDASSVQGDDYAFAPVVYVSDNAYDAQKSLAGDKAALDNGTLANAQITIEQAGVNGVVVNNSSVELDNATITVNAPEADGSTTCDFSGLGAALAVYGSSDVAVRNSTLSATGVANLAAFCDNGARLLLDNVSLSSAGGTLYENYVNSPSQPLMVAPPWILGIMGTSRGTNMMGSNSTMTVIDSTASASNWAVLSTDSGSNMYLNVVNTNMELTGSDAPFQAGNVFNVANPYTARSGYGTYAIGNAHETFLGVHMNVGTYATIFTGGSAYYGNLAAGQSYDLSAADGSTHTTYTAQEDVKTVIESDTFGFMAHQGTNTVDIDGATVHSAYTGFLIKSGNNAAITVRGGADVRADNGILVQAMDNDDSTTSYDNAADAFGTTHEEYAGFPTEAVATAQAGSPNEMGTENASGSGSGEPPSGGPGSSSSGSGSSEPPSNGASSGSGGGPDGPGGGSGSGSGEPPSGEPPAGGPGGDQGNAGGANRSSYSIQDTALEGCIYNGIGWNANNLSAGNVSAMTLDVNLTGTATLRGAIASTSCIHVSYDGQQYLKENGITAFDNAEEAARFAESYQLTSFTKAEYFNIGQVANLVSANGLNDINVSLSDDAVWTVSDTSLIASLAIANNAQVIVEPGVTLTVGGTSYAEGTYTAADFA